jgi:hypothetical protein
MNQVGLARDLIDTSLCRFPRKDLRLEGGGGCDILTQGLIGLIENSYHEGIPSFLDAHLQRTSWLSMFGPEQFQDG